MNEPVRPETVPADATWNVDQKAWIVGDTKGSGAVAYWRGDGSQWCEYTYEAGVLHGGFRRFHETGEVASEGRLEKGKFEGTTRSFRPSGPSSEPFLSPFGDRVHRIEIDYHAGAPVAQRLYDDAGEELDPATLAFAEKMERAREEHAENPSEAWAPEAKAPTRPEGVAADATWENDPPRWGRGARNDAGERAGAWRFWAMNGALLADNEYDANLLRSGKNYYPNGVVAARYQHEAGTTLQESFFDDGKPWCSLRWAGTPNDPVTADRLLAETLWAREGKILRQVENVRDEQGFALHRLKRGTTILFENVRIEGGRELRSYESGELDVSVRRLGDEAKAIFHRQGGLEVSVDASVVDDEAHGGILGHLMYEAFASLAPTMKKPEPVAALAKRCAWATEVDTRAPFANASVVNFLTALTSPIPRIAALAAQSLPLVAAEDEQRAEVLVVLDALGQVPAYAESVAKARAALVEAEDDEEDEDEDEDEGEDEDEDEEEEDEGEDEDESSGEDESDERASAERVERPLGTVTLPSGTLVLVDMGALGQWTHEGDHNADLSGSSWAGVAGAKRGDYVDLEAEGPDARIALASYVAAEGTSGLFDVTKLQAEGVQKAFAEHAAASGLDAKLVHAPRRLGHGERIRLLETLGHGHASFSFAHVNAVCVYGLEAAARTGELQVVGIPDEDGDSWERVSLVCRPTPPTARTRIGVLSVEEARFMFTDPAALAAWDHERSADGLVDVVFWGGDADDLVGTTAAESVGGVDGWRDIPGAALPRHFLQQLAAAAEGRRLCLEMRPHSSHHAVLRHIWASDDESGTATIGGVKVCGLMTKVGDGGFPVFVERDAEGQVCRVTVSFADDD